jgi:hypothetical protein
MPDLSALLSLAAEIKADLKCATESAWDRLRRFRAAGEKLTKAKKLCGHRKWSGWLEDNFALSERQAQKYMAFAKCAPEADLDKEETNWRRSSGKAPPDSRQDNDPDSAYTKLYHIKLMVRQHGKFSDMVDYLAKEDGVGKAEVIFQAVLAKFERKGRSDAAA